MESLDAFDRNVASMMSKPRAFQRAVSFRHRRERQRGDGLTYGAEEEAADPTGRQMPCEEKGIATAKGERSFSCMTGSARGAF